MEGAGRKKKRGKKGGLPCARRPAQFRRAREGKRRSSTKGYHAGLEEMGAAPSEKPKGGGGMIVFANGGK